MDAQNLPEIKPEVNKEDGQKEEEKKRSGLLFSLLSKLGGSGSAAGGMGLGGGLLATKAGIVGLILAGTTVAGGLGLVGYKVFGPGAADSSDAKFNSLFEARPKPAEAEQKAAAAKDGSSSSLDYLAKANADSSGDAAKAKADADAAAAAAAAEKEKADAAAQAEKEKAAAAAIGIARDNNAAPGGKANPALKGDKKFGELSKIGGGGGGGGSSASSSVQSPLIASSKGTIASFSSSRAPASKGASKAFSGRKFGGSAGKQLLSVRKDQTGATSSQSAGSTYDGGSASPITAGNAVPLSGTGTGTGAGTGANSNAANPSSALGNPNNLPPPPTNAGHANVTPYQGLLNTAAVMIAVAALLLFLAPKAEKAFPGYHLGAILAGAAAVLGALIIAAGGFIASCKYGQRLQGSMLTLAGGGIIAAAGAYAMTDTSSGDPSFLMLLTGGAALAATAAAVLSPKQSYDPSTLPSGGKNLDFDPFNFKSFHVQHKPPSDDALKKYLV